MAVHQIKEGDLYPPVETVLRDGNGDPVDLTGATVTFSMTAYGESVRKVDGAAVTGDTGGALDATGVVEWHPTADDVDTLGTFKATWRVAYPSGKPQTFPTVGTDIVIVHGDV